jgi:hypothetical protein
LVFASVHFCSPLNILPVFQRLISLQVQCHLSSTKSKYKLTPSNIKRPCGWVYWREAFFYQFITPKMEEKEGAAWGQPMLQVPAVLVNEYDVLSGTKSAHQERRVCRARDGERDSGRVLASARPLATRSSTPSRYAQFHALHWACSLDQLDGLFSF